MEGKGKHHVGPEFPMRDAGLADEGCTPNVKDGMSAADMARGYRLLGQVQQQDYLDKMAPFYEET